MRLMADDDGDAADDDGDEEIHHYNNLDSIISFFVRNKACKHFVH